MVMNPMLLRLLRLLKLVRLARMVKTVQSLDSLQVLIGSISACTSVLIWSSAVLGFTMTAMSIFLNAMLTPYIEGQANGGPSLEVRRKLFEYFGSYSRSMCTMFEITIGNHVPVTRYLVENVAEGYGVFFAVYRFVVGFAVVKVITGVFLHETFRVAASDDDLMIVQKVRATRKHVKKMQLLFERCEVSTDGMVTRKAFLQMTENRLLKTWLESMELELDNPHLLFDLLDDGDGLLTFSELVRGVARLKGPARSIDLATVIARCEGLHENIAHLTKKFDAVVAAGRDHTPALCCPPPFVHDAPQQQQQQQQQQQLLPQQQGETTRVYRGQL
eukprot:NODE_1078_length_1248_cov_303.816429.p1 GENE.NODE_1078_length_1248_cov_303.816429~~NODE_1078_length_1248_cov_303.816429.p1  ORF type:complete len:384 (+),score=127.72 NODE_1078_length_1248_cov_303.816429:160-1152(+)